MVRSSFIKAGSLESIFANYSFEKMAGNGFLPIPLPTGSGKSTAIFNFIYYCIKEKLTNDKIVLITSLKKNLQIDALKKVFTDHDDLELYNKHVLFIKSNIDCVMDNLPDLMKEKQIPEAITELPVFTELYSAVSYCNKYENYTDPETQDAVKERCEKIMKELEPNFRFYIRKTLKSEFEEKLGKRVRYQVKLDYINGNGKKAWQWLLKLYPQILTNERQVYVMSMDKFLLRNDPIIDGTYFIYKRLCNNSIIFIDEFDATKETVLKRLIENAVNNKIDYVAAFTQIRDRLTQGKFSAEMTTPSQRQAESENGKERLEKVIPGWNERAAQITERFNMQFVFKNAQDISENETFLFQNIHSLLISKTKDKKRIVFKTNQKIRQNEIFLTSENLEDEKSLTYMVKDVRGFLRFFCGGVWILATNLMERKDEANQEYTIENAVNSILDNFFPGQDNEYRKYFKDAILLYYTTKDENRINAFDASFFENGFTFYSIEDENDHSLRSAIIMTELESTPEKILLDLCKKNRVFGVSATANYDTLVGNYALKNYLIPKLNKHYYELNKEESKILEERFENSISNYSQVEIKAIPIQTRDIYSVDSWKDLLDEEDAEEIYTELQQLLSNELSKEFYFEKRYLRVAQVFKSFIENDDIKSFLCLLTTFPASKETMNKKFLKELFNLLGKDKYTFKDNVYLLKGGADYEANRNEIKDRLSKGEKLLVISTYATVGAGQNLQYKIPEGIPTVRINSFPASEEKDFDAIYLDKPTNLLVQLQQFDTQENLVRYIAQAEYLKESGEISFKQSRKIIEDAFRLVFFGQKGAKIPLNDKRSYTSYVTKMIVQAIGRICRTNMKSPVIHIFYDSEIGKYLNRALCDRNLLNPEFKALLESIPESPIPDTSIQYLEELATTRSEYSLSRIIKFVEEGRQGWKHESIKDWQELRVQVLKYPVMTQEQFDECEERFKPFYIELPIDNDRTFFEREGDYNFIQVHFTKTDKSEVVSTEAARLSALLSVPCVKELFEEQGYAMEFKKAKYILCPPVFTNIYKGALGEVAGKAIFAQEGIQLEEISNPDLFELFDYKVPDKDIYVDFKHWSEYSSFLPRNEELQDHIFNKLKKCNGKKALIVNLLAENDYVIHNQKLDNLELRTIPKLYESEHIPVKHNEEKLHSIIDFIRG